MGKLELKKKQHANKFLVHVLHYSGMLNGAVINNLKQRAITQ